MTDIPISEVAKTLGLNVDIQYLWHKNGILPFTGRGQRATYTVEAVNAFLAIRTSSSQRPITLEDLAMKRVELISLTQAHELTGIGRWKLKEHIEKVRITSVKLAVLKVVKAEVLALPQPVKDVVSFERVAHTLGLSISGVHKFRIVGMLRVVRRNRVGFVTLDSLVTLAGTLLPDWIKPEDWIAEVIDLPLPLVPFTTVRHQCGEVAIAYMQQRKLRYVHPFKDEERYVSPVSVLEMVSQGAVATHQTFALLFDESVGVITRWEKEGHLVCTIHPHSDGTLYDICAQRILRKHLSKNIAYHRWYLLRVHGEPEPLLTLEQAAQQLDILPEEVVARASEGSLYGLQTPDGNWKFRKRWIERLRIKLAEPKL